MKLKDLGEDALIDIIAAAYSPATGNGIEKALGDDTSVTTQEGSRLSTLVTTDTLVEGLHFKDSYSTPYLIGKKLLSVSLSDIAAMGARAKYFLISLVLSPECTDDYVKELYRGLNERAEEAGVALIGGNTTSAGNGTNVMTSTVIGEAQAEKIIYREGASAGEDIYMTGTVGDSALGLKVLGEDLNEPYKDAVRRHLDPQARSEAGALLGERSLATSMLDISDGFMKDLSRLTTAGKVGAKMMLTDLPLSTDTAKYIELTPKGYDLLLSGGEDYELLFTAKKGKAMDIQSISKELGLRITNIGETTGEEEIIIVDHENKPVELKLKGFEHFK
ncbi:MAG: thiamine-phosphate kinase [Deltaproteobacteria bacterium]|nr:thiamine-phosphate kinase [Deltaproteobacteria bacterium]